MTDAAKPAAKPLLARYLAGSPRPAVRTILFSGLGGFLAILALTLTADLTQLLLLVPPFGASCVLAFGLPDSPLAQPRNIIGGHFISALVGLLCLLLFGLHGWSIAIAVGLAIMAMQATGTVHPPAGANPILVMLTGAGFSFLFAPILLGAVVVVLVAIAYNNAVPGRVYPKP
jgi:CBS-domain-containing membrane protein